MAGGPGRGVRPVQAADFEQLKPERLDLREHAIQRGAVGQRPGQHAAAGLSLQSRERGAYRLAQAAADTDAVPVCRQVGVGTGHVLTRHAVNRPARGSKVIGTGTGDPSCVRGFSPRAAAPTADSGTALTPAGHPAAGELHRSTDADGLVRRAGCQPRRYTVAAPGPAAQVRAGLPYNTASPSIPHAASITSVA